MKTTVLPPAETGSASRFLLSENAPLRIKTILVPVDFSEAGKPALRYARSLAQLAGASLWLVHVMERIYSAGDVYGGGEFTYIQLDTSKMRERIRRELGALQAGFFRGIKTHFEIREGSSSGEIVDAAREAKADIIVMATHGYTGLRHIVMGSTTERVVRHAGCPVLVVRSKLPRKAKPKPRKPGA